MLGYAQNPSFIPFHILVDNPENRCYNATIGPPRPDIPTDLCTRVRYRHAPTRENLERG
jgi:hypothetical protein